MQRQLFQLPKEEARSSNEEAELIVQGLNREQQEAVRTSEGPVLIIAGPGSGKTRTLTHRIAYLIAAGKARPYQILALTFTNKAAREMKERIQKLVGDTAAKGMWMGTFHATFARLLRTEADKIGFTADFSIYDTDDSERILKQLMERFRIDSKQFSTRLMRSLISGAKNGLVSPAEYARLAVTEQQAKAAQLYGPYEEALRRANAMDFDDLLIRPIELFQKSPETLERYQTRWSYVHIDEYQDTNHAQYVLAKMLADKHRNICVVGDDAQSIYAFRGADIGNILSFQRDYPDAKVIRLEQNYRSTKRILQLADSIIKRNQDRLDKELWTDNREGDYVVLMEALSEKDEAQKIERTIRDLQVRLGHTYREFAVLYRTNSQSRSIEDALRRGSIPYRVVGGTPFFQRKEIKDVLAYLRLVVNPNDTASITRVINYPARGIGEKTQEELAAFARREGVSLWQAIERVEEVGLAPRAQAAVERFRFLIAQHAAQATSRPADEIARSIAEDTGILHELHQEKTEESLMRWQNVQELISGIAEFAAERGDEAGSLSAFLQDVSLMTDADGEEEDTNRVTLMTLHASKGLEFPVVFISGLEEGLFPLSMASQERKDLEEERRLFYVGVTRAQERLFLSYARSRFRYGNQEPTVRSRFLDEIDVPDVIRTEAGGMFNGRSDRFSLGASTREISYNEMDPYYYRRNLRQNGGPQQKSRTAARKSAPSSERRVVYDEDQVGIVPGMIVEHDLFGEGKVLAIEGAGDQAKATVFFKEVGQKKLMLKFAKLRRVG